MIRPSIRFLAAATLLAATLAACGGKPGETATPTSGRLAGGTLVDLPLTGAQLGFQLTAQDGRTFTLADLSGKTVVVTDFLTRCQEICPMISVNANAVARAVDQAGLSDQVVVLEGTVDAQGDGAARLAAYRKLFPAAPAWTLFTASGSTGAFWKSFGVFAQRTDAEKPYARDWQTGKPVTYDYEHQDVVIIIDAHGHERWVLAGGADARGSTLPSALDSFLSDEGHDNLAHADAQSWTPAAIEQALTEITGRQIG